MKAGGCEVEANNNIFLAEPKYCGLQYLMTCTFYILCLLFLHFQVSMLEAYFIYTKYLVFSFIQHLKGFQKIDLPGLLWGSQKLITLTSYAYVSPPASPR